MSETETGRASLAVGMPVANVSVNVSGAGSYPMTIESAEQSQGIAQANFWPASQWSYPTYYGGQPQMQSMGNAVAAGVEVSTAPSAMDQQRANVQARNPQSPTVHFADTSGGFQQPPYLPNFPAAGQVYAQQPGYNANVAYYQPGYSGYPTYVQPTAGADVADGFNAGAETLNAANLHLISPRLPPCMRAQFLLIGVAQMLCALGLFGVEVYGIIVQTWLSKAPVILIVGLCANFMSGMMALIFSCDKFSAMWIAISGGVVAAVSGILVCILGGVGLSINGNVPADQRDGDYWSRLLVNKLRIVFGATGIVFAIWLILAIALMFRLKSHRRSKDKQPVAEYRADQPEVTANLLPSAPPESVEPAAQSAPPAEQPSVLQKSEEIS